MSDENEIDLSLVDSSLSRQQYRGYLHCNNSGMIPTSTIRSQELRSLIPNVHDKIHTSECDAIPEIDCSFDVADEQSPPPKDLFVPQVDSQPILTEQPCSPESFSEPELNLHSNLSISEAIQLFILRSKMSFRNAGLLVDLLNFIKNQTLADSNIKIPSKNSIINPPNFALKEQILLCPNDGEKLEDGKCSACNKSDLKPDFLSIGNLNYQFTSLLADHNFSNLISRTKQNLNKGITNYDIFKFNTYKNLISKLGATDYTLCLNSDGFQINSTSKTEPWPLYLVINELPYKVRFSMRYLVFLGIYYGKKHPNLNKILKQAIDPQIDIFKRGITFNGSVHIFRIIYASLDKPARASLMEMTSHSSLLGCIFCLQRMVTLEVNGKKHKTFPIDNALSLLREDDDFIATGISCDITSESQYGQKASTFLENFQEFKPVSSQIIDLMHCLYGGCVKKICMLLFDFKYRNKPFSCHSRLASINAIISSLRPPSHFITRIRSFNNINFFRSHEYTSFILFYGPIILKEFVSQEQYDNLILLAKIAFICSRSSLNETLIIILEETIKYFLASFQSIYGREFLTINFHELIHIPNNIRNNGSIFNLSCFGFENFNKLLKQSIHGIKSDLEVFRKYNLLINSTRGFDFNEDSEVGHLSRKFLSSTNQCKLRKLLANGIGIYSNIKPSSDNIECVTHKNLYEVYKVKISHEFITSGFYDVKYKYRNSFLVNPKKLLTFKVLKIYIAETDSGDMVVFKGIEGKTRKVDGLYYEIIGNGTKVYKTDLNGYFVAFLVRRKLITIPPNFIESY